MVAQSDKGEGLVKLVWMSSMKVNLGDYGNVGGIWKSSIGVNDNSFVGKEVCGLWLGDDDEVVRFSKS